MRQFTFITEETAHDAPPTARGHQLSDHFSGRAVGLSYDLLIRQLGYSLDRFEQWIADTLIACLLPPVENCAAPDAGDTAGNR